MLECLQRAAAARKIQKCTQPATGFRASRTASDDGFVDPHSAVFRGPGRGAGLLRVAGEAELGGIRWYRAAPGGAGRGGIAWYWPVPGGAGRGGIARYCVVLACPGWARKRGIGLSGFTDLKDWNLWKALGNCARGGGIARYCVVLAFPAGARKGRYWAVLRGIGLSRLGPGRGGIRRYWAVLACPRRHPEGAVLGSIGRYWPLLAGFECRRFFLGWDFVN